MVEVEEEDDFRVSGLHGTIGEQLSEDHFDLRSNADDDLEKGRIRFPRGKLYGRDKELENLKRLYDKVAFARTDDEAERGQATEKQGGSCDDGPTKQIVFLAGLSGVGKSALVKELIRQVIKDETGSPRRCPLFGCGKFVQHGESTPFSAISEALADWTSGLLKRGEAEELKQVRSSIKKAGLGRDDEGGKVLEGTFPVLSPLLDVEGQATPAAGTSAPPHFSMNALKIMLQTFIIALCRKQDRPLIMFIDDLQWADEASLEIITALLTSKLKHILFVGAFRSNEINDEHPFQKRMEEIKEGASGEAVHDMEIYNLSPHDIGQFIADSTEKDLSDVASLTDTIYRKTLGNIFFTMHALEELARRNVLYYDIITYEWAWNLDMGGTELESFVNADVLSMVKSKIERLDKVDQRALVLASFTRNIIEVTTLHSLLNDDGFLLNVDQVLNLLDNAVTEGLLLKSDRDDEFSFAHDQIQAAAYSCVPPGEDRDRLLVQVAKVLLDRSSLTGEDWMLFVAANHFNSVPYQYLDSLNFLAELNLRVAEVSSRKAALSKAVDLLRKGVGCLPDWQNYELCLSLYNSLLKAEVSVGNYSEAKSLIEKVLQNATCYHDRIIALKTLIRISALDGNRDYSKGAEKGADILQLPSHPRKIDVALERLRLKVESRNRPLKELVNAPAMKDDSAMCLFSETQEFAITSGNNRLATLVALKALRIAYSRGICPDLAHIVQHIATGMVQKRKFKSAYGYANLAAEVMKQFSNEQSSADYCTFKMKLLGGVFHLRQPFYDDIEVWLEYYKAILSSGAIEFAMGCRLAYCLSYYAAGIPLNSLFGSKLKSFERSCFEFGQRSFGLPIKYGDSFSSISVRRHQKATPQPLKEKFLMKMRHLSKLKAMQRRWHCVT